MDQLTTVFLSPTGVEQALSMFDRIVTKKEFDFDVTLRFSKSDWNDFDKIYLDLYRLTLLRAVASDRKNTLRLRVDDDFERSLRDKDERSSLVKVECMLDIELENKESPRHLLSEFAVHSLIDFRHAFSNVVEYETFVTYLDIGCIVIAFGVQLQNAQMLAEFHGIQGGRDAARSLVESRLSTERWKRISEQYSVIHQSVDGILLQKS